jgi:hypothetical protein
MNNEYEYKIKNILNINNLFIMFVIFHVLFLLVVPSEKNLHIREFHNILLIKRTNILSNCTY